MMTTVGRAPLFIAVLLLHCVAVVLAQISLSDPVPQPSSTPSNPTPELEFFPPSNASSCSPMSMSWFWSNVDNADLVTLTIRITNNGVEQAPPVAVTTPDPLDDLSLSLRRHRRQSSTSQILTTSVLITEKAYVWPLVTILEDGWYVLEAFPTVPAPTTGALYAISSRFFVQATDVSCLAAASSNSASISSTPSLTSTPSSSSETSAPQHPPPPGGGGLSKGGIAGAVVGVLVGVGALIGAFFFCIRRRPGAARRHPADSLDKPKGGGTWGGLRSIDYSGSSSRGSPTDGITPSSTPGGGSGTSTVPNPLGSAFAFATARRNRSRQNSLSRNSLSRVGEEDEDSLNEEKMLGVRDSTVMVPPRSGSNSATTSASGHTGAATRPRNGSLRTSNQSLADHYNEMARASRALSVALPSLNSSNRGSLDGPLVPSHTHPALPPQHSRTNSANALGRPARKPVPTYQEPPIELTNSSSTNLAAVATPYGSAQTGSTFLSERGHKQSLGSRSYGSSLGLPGDLPGEGDGPVHYLIPDLPPPQKD